MATLYGKELPDQEIKKLVSNYIESVKNSSTDRFHTIMSLFPNNTGRILDYGCGWGHYSLALRDKGNTVEAIDLSQNEIDICNIIWGRQRDVNFAANPIDQYDEASFDGVLSNQVIEHVHNVGNYLSGINRVLKAEGKLIISLPNIMNPRFIVKNLNKDMENSLKQHSQIVLDKYDKASDHINAWDPQHFTTLLSSMGFLLERYIPTEGIPMPSRRPFGSYVNLPNSRLSNLSYTMTFQFKKVRNLVRAFDE